MKFARWVADLLERIGRSMLEGITNDPAPYWECDHCNGEATVRSPRFGVCCDDCYDELAGYPVLKEKAS